MLKSILIGLDGSAYSTTALELGIRWARRFDALLVGLGVIDEPTIRGPEPVPLGGAYYKPIFPRWLTSRAPATTPTADANPRKVRLQGFPSTQCRLDSRRRGLSPLHEPLPLSSASASGSRDAPRTHGHDLPTR
jgi:hypothetical protein